MDKEKDKLTKRLVVDMDPDLHYLLKSLALKRNITLKQLILRLVSEFILKEKKYE